MASAYNAAGTLPADQRLDRFDLPQEGADAGRCSRAFEVESGSGGNVVKSVRKQCGARMKGKHNRPFGCWRGGACVFVGLALLPAGHPASAAAIKSLPATLPLVI